MTKVSSMVCDPKPRVERVRKWIRRNAKEVFVGIISGLVIANLFFLNGASADADTGPRYLDDATVALLVRAMQNQTVGYGHLPTSEDSGPRHTLLVPITAYTSETGQTDDTPCIAARGFDLCAHNEEDVVAANFLPMGTKLRIPELYGDRVFTVVDRMNPRYSRHLDIWMRAKADAKTFGVKYAAIEVF